MSLDLSSFKNVVASLEAALDVVGDTTWFDRQSEKVKDTLIAGVIQNFEFVYEIGFKMIVGSDRPWHGSRGRRQRPDPAVRALYFAMCSRASGERWTRF